MGQTIQHRGIVERTEGDRIFVSVERQSACAGCHAKGICGNSGNERRIIEVNTPYATEFKVGERVMVALLRNSMGISSIVWSYLVPLALLLATLFGAKYFNMADGAAAVTTLAVVALYYVGLYLFRRQFDKHIQFTIVKEQ